MNKKPIKVTDLLRYKFPENLQYNPSGNVLAFQVATADQKTNTYKRNVYLVKDKKVKQLTTNDKSALLFWLDDTHVILTKFEENASPETIRYYIMDIEGGEPQEWISLPLPIERIKKINKNEFVFTTTIDENDPDYYKDDEKIRKKKIDQLKKEKDYEVIDEIPYWLNARGFINKKRTALFTLELKNKPRLQRITPKNFSVDDFCVDGKKVYYIGSTKGRNVNLKNKIYQYSLTTKKKEGIYTENTHSFNSIFMLKNQLYVTGTTMEEYGLNETSAFYKITKKGLEFIRKPERALYCSVNCDTLLSSGKNREIFKDQVYSIVTDEDTTAIWKFGKSFKKTEIYRSDGPIFFFDITKDKIAFVKATSSALAEVYEVDLQGTREVQLTNLNDDILRDKYVAKPHLVPFKSEGENLHGWVLLPNNFRKTKKYPAVLEIHGGPRTVYGNNFMHEMQCLASKGYVVMFCNILGSDGRGDEFADIRGRYGYEDFNNLMDFVDAVLKKYPNIDKKRLCEAGGSYGGFMTNWIITHTNRFCCVVSQRSISNWMSMALVSDIGPYFVDDQCGVKGIFNDKSVEAFWEHSPLKYAKACKTPTLFIHSDEDYRCPLPEGMQMMQALAYNNIETRMVIFRGENHELSRSGKPLHRIRRLVEIIDWFDQHTK